MLKPLQIKSIRNEATRTWIIALHWARASCGWLWKQNAHTTMSSTCELHPLSVRPSTEGTMELASQRSVVFKIILSPHAAWSWTIPIGNKKSYLVIPWSFPLNAWKLSMHTFKKLSVTFNTTFWLYDSSCRFNSTLQSTNKTTSFVPLKNWKLS